MVEQQSPTPSPTLEYASLPSLLPSLDIRDSRLAIASLFVAILGSPCLIAPLSDLINWYVPQQFNQVGRYGFIHAWIIRGAMIFATVLPVIAFIRIRLSRGTRTGTSMVVAAFSIALLWWVLTYLLWLAFRDWRRD